MPGYVVAAVLFAALLHACWNALVKSGRDTFLTTVLVAGGAGLAALVALPFVDAPQAASWPYIAGSTVVQLLYFELLIATYRSGDMSHAYPIMRGTAPLIVALASGLLMNEELAAIQWLAILCICGAILGLGLTGSASPNGRRTTQLALATACLIASYTIIDGMGVRKSGATAGYAMWVFLLTGSGFALWALRQRPGELLPYAKENWHIALLGGAGSFGAYGIALWAMTKAPVATVAALRETSILFATLIAALVLREKISKVRYGAIVLIAAGALLMRLH
jgi:drug/metabolite transporter (DMT)-like permease